MAQTTLIDAGADAETVRAFLEASLVPDPETAQRYIAPELAIPFTGGRKYRHPRETAALHAGRHQWVKNKMERVTLVPGEDKIIDYSLTRPKATWSAK